MGRPVTGSTIPPSLWLTCVTVTAGVQAARPEPMAAPAVSSAVYGSRLIVARGLSQMLATMRSSHFVPVQNCVLVHAFPHDPQFVGSAAVFTHAPLQQVSTPESPHGLAASTSQAITVPPSGDASEASTTAASVGAASTTE